MNNCVILERFFIQPYLSFCVRITVKSSKILLQDRRWYKYQLFSSISLLQQFFSLYLTLNHRQYAASNQWNWWQDSRLLYKYWAHTFTWIQTATKDYILTCTVRLNSGKTAFLLNMILHHKLHILQFPLTYVYFSTIVLNVGSSFEASPKFSSISSFNKWWVSQISSYM